MAIETFAGMTVTSADTLGQQNYEPIPELIQDILTPGAYLLAGRPKIGKSFMALQIAYSVAMRIDFLGKSTMRSDVLYLALEDSMQRIHKRATAMFGRNLPDKLHITIEAEGVSYGLIGQLGAFLAEYPDTKLIIVDTLQVAGGNITSYRRSYDSILQFKDFAYAHNLCVLIIHHTNKSQKKGDPFAAIMGSQGLMGAVDGAWVLEARCLYTRGRDISEDSIPVAFDKEKLLWELDEITIPVDPVIELIADFVSDIGKWQGNSTELLAALPSLGEYANRTTLTKKLNENAELLRNCYNIKYEHKNTGTKKLIILEQLEDDGSWLPDDFDWDGFEHDIGNYSHAAIKDENKVSVPSEVSLAYDMSQQDGFDYFTDNDNYDGNSNT